MEEVKEKKRQVDEILKKRISEKRIHKIIWEFVENSFLEVVDCEPFNGAEEYYLLHAEDYTKEQILDYTMFFNTIRYLLYANKGMNSRTKKFFNVEQLLTIYKGSIIFKYKYNQQYFKDWQDRLYMILTLQELPKN